MESDDKFTAEMVPEIVIDEPAADLVLASDAKASAAPGPKRTVEHWAHAKGMLHEFSDGKPLPTARPKQKPPQIHNPEVRHFRAARAVNHWPIGMELTEAEFDAAIEATKAHVYR